MGEPLVIIGKGMAATKLVEELTSRQLGRYDIVVVGAEPRWSYNRVLLSSVLAGEVLAADIELKPARWWRDRGVTTVVGQAVTSVDHAARRVRLTGGGELSYAKLVFATGSTPVRLPKPGMTLPGVITFRDLADIDSMMAAAQAKQDAVVIGGGLLGLEAAYGLAKAGVRVTLVHLMDRLMERQLDGPAAALLKQAIELKGVEIVLGADTVRVIGETRAEGLELGDGRIISAALIVCTVGIRPNAALAQEAGFAVNRGIVVDDRMEASEPGIFALGECAEHRGVPYGLVEPAYEQAKVLAAHLCGDQSATYEGTVLSTNLKVSGVNLFSAGDFQGRDGSQSLIFDDPGGQTYKKLVIENGMLTGAILFGDTGDGLWYLDLIRSRRPLAAMRETLIFGRALSESVAAGSPSGLAAPGAARLDAAAPDAASPDLGIAA